MPKSWKAKYCALLGKGWLAATSSVFLPKSIYLDNTGLAMLHRFMLFVIAMGVIALVIFGKQYLVERIPQTSARLWTTYESSFGTDAANLLSTGSSPATHCVSPGNQNYSFWTDYGFHAKDFSCVDPAHFGDSELVPNAGTSELYVPFYFGEKWYERQVESGTCTSLKANDCEAAGAEDDASGDFAAGKSGAKKFTAGASNTCQCEMNNTHHFTVGVENTIVKLDHKMSVDDPNGKFAMGYSNKDKDTASSTGYVPIMSVVMTYDKVDKKWKEASCGTSATSTQEAHQCRFEGAPVGMKVSDWIAAAGVADLDTPNPFGGTNAQTSYTHGGGTASLNTNPTYRLSGMQIVIQIEYLDINYHTVVDWDAGNGSKKRFPGTVAYFKLQTNPQWTTRVQREFSSIPDASVGSGKTRVRTYNGLSLIVSNSTNSKFGFYSFAAFIQYLAVCVVYFTFATQAIMLFAVYVLGNTSRNYERCVREHCAVAIWAARRTPVKLFQAMTTFIWMREWQKAGTQVLSHYLDDSKAIHKSTIHHFLRTCYNPKFQHELTMQDIDQMTEACWTELGGHEGEQVTLIEYLDCALSSEVVDYQATKAAFTLSKPKGILERILGDNVKSYKAGATKAICCGLIPLDTGDAARQALLQNFNDPTLLAKGGLKVFGDSTKMMAGMGKGMAKFGLGGLTKVTKLTANVTGVAAVASATGLIKADEKKELTPQEDDEIEKGSKRSKIGIDGVKEV